MSAYDIDLDGKVDLLAGNTWFKQTGGKQFKAIRIAEVGGLDLRRLLQARQVSADCHLAR